MVVSASPSSSVIELRKAKSPLDPRVSLSFKETHICETTPGVKSFSGYVNVPANPAEGRLYDIHTFFWFFEARKSPKHAPLALWLQGGPGAPSTPAALGENGPCYVNNDSRTTRLNPWSWNNEVNMLYIDQPVQTGFSYDQLINGTVDETVLPYVVTPVPETSPIPELNSTFLLGTFPSQDPSSTANTTTTAALAAWHFMQTWIKEFPKYKPRNNEFSIWGESYGGHYAPVFANFFTEQNKKAHGAVKLRIDTVGIVNGCIDVLEQMEWYPKMARNNTYGLELITEEEYNAAMAAIPACHDIVMNCRTLADEKDPEGRGNNPEVNQACAEGYEFCFQSIWGGVQAKGRNVFDITATVPGHFPPKYVAGYLNSKEIRDALGVPLNISGLSTASNTAMLSTGDFLRNKNLKFLGDLLDQGVKVHLMYGDRDYQCNWYGGEQVSLAINSRLAPGFRKAGYARIRTNSNSIGGYVRQHGHFSFSRVLDAGHEAPWYQPETTYRIFHRATFNTDIATGRVPVEPKPAAVPPGVIYSTEGPASVAHIANELPTHPARSECYLWDVFETCTPEQALQLRNGTAVVRDYVMVGYVQDDGEVVYYEE
ncbi:hypothetical protein VTK26DRAFT_1138 [Humicola hyalothermophila]